MKQEESTQKGLCRLLLDDAFTALYEGDLQQASEKGWGAATQMLKAIAKKRGWKHHNERDSYSIVSRLRLETRNPDLTSLFGAVTSLRLNASRSWLATQDVEDHLRRVGQFVKRLETPPHSPRKVTKQQLAPPSKEQSRLLLHRARKELYKGYLMEASKNGWLAAFEMARVLGERSGYRISNQGDFIRFISTQCSQAGDSEWTTMMSSATNLQMNSLENWLAYGYVKLLLETVEMLVDRLEALLDTPA